MDWYKLSRNWFDWCFENPEKISPNHSAIYFFAIEHCNRLGWKEKFWFPTQMAMDALGIKKHETYIRYFNDICEWGFFILIQKSTNQYSANIISLSTAIPKKGKALDKAFLKHRGKQIESIGESNRSINKQVTNKPETKKQILGSAPKTRGSARGTPQVVHEVHPNQTQLNQNKELYSKNEELNSAITEWVEYKKERKEWYKPTWLKSFITQCHSHTPDSVIEQMQSAMSSWWKWVVWEKCIKIPYIDTRFDFSDPDTYDPDLWRNELEKNPKLWEQLKYQNEPIYRKFKIQIEYFNSLLS